MKLIIIFPILFCLCISIRGQQPFILSLEQPELDFISDVVQISDRFYFIQNRLVNLEPPFDSDSYSDIIITSTDGSIIEQYNLNGFRTEYHRILKVIGDDIYLIGCLKSDSCLSRFVISKFNIQNHTLYHLSSYDYCENVILNIKIVEGLSQQTFIKEYHSIGSSSGTASRIFNLDSTYSLKLVFKDIHSSESFSIDFSRKGYLIASSHIYRFYDVDFNFRKQGYLNEDISYYFNESHKPFGHNLMLVQTIQPKFDHPETGVKIMLIDSVLKVKKKVVILPLDYIGTLNLPFFDGIAIKSENEIWASGFIGQPPYFDSGVYSITKLDSNLNIICQHFLGYETKYRIFGIRALESGGAIVFGNRVRAGHLENEGEDIFAIRVGENCELPSTVSTNGPVEILQSISAYPNPGINDLTFLVNGFDPATLRVEMIDQLGQVLFTAKDLTYSIAVPELPAGQYFYRILQKERLLGVGSWVKQ